MKVGGEGEDAADWPKASEMLPFQYTSFPWFEAAEGIRTRPFFARQQSTTVVENWWSSWSASYGS